MTEELVVRFAHVVPFGNGRPFCGALRFRNRLHDRDCTVECGDFPILFCSRRIPRWITEFAVTDRRVIYKCEFISRHTAEMNMDKIESVDVDQSLLGRVLNYGTIHVLGTGEGIESLHRIAAPLALRNAITAK
jgi:hypothetical protein